MPAADQQEGAVIHKEAATALEEAAEVAAVIVVITVISTEPATEGGIGAVEVIVSVISVIEVTIAVAIVIDDDFTRCKHPSSLPVLVTKD